MKPQKPIRSLLHKLVGIAALASICLVSPPARALMILSPPSFTSTTNAPLAGRLLVTTDVRSRVSVSVNDGTSTWTRDFLNYTNDHSEILAGFKPGRSNQITVTVRDSHQNAVTAPQPVVFNTDPLPSDYPKIVLFTNQPALMEPGYTLFRVVNNNTRQAYLTIVDNAAQVVWYSSTIPSTLEVKQMDNGDLFLPQAYSFLEANLMGEQVQSWPVVPAWGINSHDGTITDHGTILYISDYTRTVTNFPTSATNPNAPTAATAVLINRIVELSMTNSVMLTNWTLIDMLQPTRIDYLTFTIHNTDLGWDCEHANAVIQDPRDDSVIVSIRHQDAVIKFSRTTGQLKWILGPHENWASEFQPYLLTPVGTNFQWNYAQHSPTITAQGTIILYDDGNFRASPFAPGAADATNYSRAVEYSINEQTMEVTQVWDFGRTNGLQMYTDRLGSADVLPQTGNVLVHFGNVDYVNGLHPSPYSTKATLARIQEVTRTADPQVVFDMALFDYTNTSASYMGTYAYRSHRIPDLYGHLPQPVTDLEVQIAGGEPVLQFSGDQTRSYSVEASTDLGQWESLGLAVFNGDGNFSFTDSESSGFPERYYRVVTN